MEKVLWNKKRPWQGIHQLQDGNYIIAGQVYLGSLHII